MGAEFKSPFNTETVLVEQADPLPNDDRKVNLPINKPAVINLVLNVRSLFPVLYKNSKTGSIGQEVN